MSAKTIEIGKGHPTNLDANYSLDWLADADTLQTSTGSEFGRNIESYIETIKVSHAPIRLNVRKRPAAVVIGIDEYEEMLSMKAQFADLVVRVKEAEIAQASNEFDELFARISSAHSRKTADALHNVTTEELANSYQPGRTERN
ncbi:MAG: hypothetical protein Q7T48_17985 [Cellvibrio sp.]|uniref:type II toxin-antitoxin system Phd/YefM family antitoxin n=1 Tax=Cellvibrio sp. TaxID=1965322 RepID=UPI002723F8D2|nr:hypothetical protein [Cellvibrio sp.]